MDRRGGGSCTQVDCRRVDQDNFCPVLLVYELTLDEDNFCPVQLISLLRGPIHPRCTAFYMSVPNRDVYLTDGEWPMELVECSRVMVRK